MIIQKQYAAEKNRVEASDIDSDYPTWADGCGRCGWAPAPVAAERTRD